MDAKKQHHAAYGLVWQVGALCMAVGDALDARFASLSVEGEIGAPSRAASGHIYFTLKDAQGQMRCVLFRRAALLLDAPLRDGDRVQVRGRLAVYAARGDLQIVAESVQRAGAGALYEELLRRKQRLAAQGLFDAARKRPLPACPRGIALVTSLGAAALHDVARTLARRAPHLPVLLIPAAVQGAQAPAQLIAALERAYALARTPCAHCPPIDAIALVRGGGSIEDLWAFNDESLAQTVARSPVALITGIGHDTDRSLADLCADAHAPTPTAAAELIAPARDALWQQAQQHTQHLRRAVQQHLHTQAQHLDRLGWGLQSAAARIRAQAQQLAHLRARLHAAQGRSPQQHQQVLALLQQRLQLLHPQHTLQRGFALLRDAQGRVLCHRADFAPRTPIRAQVADGEVALRVKD